MKKWISKAARHAQLQHRKKVEWREWHFDFLREAISLGLQTDFPILVGQPAEAEEKADACLVCHRFFRTRAAWAVHAFKNHQRTAPEREVIQTSRCEACMREYRTPTKLLAHLRHSKVCHAKLRRAGHRYDLLPGRGHRDEYKDSSFPIPVLPSAGPRLPRMANEDEPMDEVIDLPLLEGLMDAFAEMPEDCTYEEGCDRIIEFLQNHVLCFSQAKANLKIFFDDFEQTMDGDLRIPMWRASSIMGFVLTTFRFHNYFQSTEMCEGIDDEVLRGAVWEHCKNMKEQMRWREGNYVPRLISKNIVILHLFSGERRANDLQSFLSELNFSIGALPDYPFCGHHL